MKENMYSYVLMAVAGMLFQKLEIVPFPRFDQGHPFPHIFLAVDVTSLKIFAFLMAEK